MVRSQHAAHHLNDSLRRSRLPSSSPHALLAFQSFPNLFKMHLPPLDVAVYPVVSMNYGRYARTSTRPSSTTSNDSFSSSSSSSTCAPTTDFSSIQKTIQGVFRSTKVTVKEAECLTGRLHQVYLARLADGSALVLKYPPHRSTRALRHERYGLETEHKTLEILRGFQDLPVPQAYKYKARGGNLDSSFLLMSYVPGTRLADLLPRLSAKQRSAIDYTLGTYVRALTMLTATSFGTTHEVFSKKGRSTWRETFLALLESALRDGEDMLVTLPYDSIRYYINQHAHELDDVKTPYMIPLGMCDPQNVLIHEQTSRITGLVGFSNVFWGDPLMNCGIANDSDAFFQGLGERPPQTGAPYSRRLM